MGRRIVIIGNGIAGITAARQIRKRCDDEITVFSGETDHFFSRTALMYVYMGHMRFEETKPYEDRFWEKNRIRLRRAWVQGVDVANRRLDLGSGDRLAYDLLVVASGSRSNKFGWPGQDLQGVQGLYSYPDLQTMEESTRDIERAVVVGGGLIGIETVEMLLSRKIPVTFLVREPGFMSFAYPAEESAMIDRQIREHRVDYRVSTELDRILPDDRGRVRAVVTKSGETIECGFVALTVGVSPNIGFLSGSGIECDRGVLVDEQLRTSAEDVFAVGDCAQLRQPAPGRRPVEPLWYTGRAMGETVARTICGKPTAYRQGSWFNSAKFFDLEWQVYGQVPALPDDEHGTLYWEHADGRHAIRLNYRKKDRALTGVNLMGIRYRHELCKEWLESATPLDQVLPELGAANFDPEFHRQFEGEVVRSYNQRFPDRPVRLRRRRGLVGWLKRRRAS